MIDLERTARTLAADGRRGLAGRFAGGAAIAPEAIGHGIYRGVSLGLPALVQRASWTTFEKIVVRDDRGLHGDNRRIDQRAPFAFEPLLRDGRPVRFGRFRVIDAGPLTPAPARATLDYSPGPPVLHRLRDPLVAIDVEGADVLLGRSYLAVAGRWFATPSFFVLARTSGRAPPAIGLEHMR